MCGICGVVSSNRTEPFGEERLLRMRDALLHRGPDDSGTWETPSCALASRRLAVLDLSRNGHMPMGTPDGRYWIAYNGEVYNFRELRKVLEGKGHVFRSASDTEVLLLLYAEEGPTMLARLNGMFALAIWDERKQELFLARDRLGVKPLYYADQEGELWFASEQKALFAAGVKATFDVGTWEELLCFRFVAGERTPFHGIKRLLPGHCLTWRDGAIATRRWWALGEHVARTRETIDDPVAWFREVFDDSVRLRRISDVPVGVLLSGGLDSSVVAASLGAQEARDVVSFTVRFREEGYDEGPLARQVAERWQLRSEELFVDDDELIDLVDYCSWLNDEPLAHANDLHLFAIARHAKPLVTVLLSGEGADEFLGGYVRYRPLRFAPTLLRMAPIVRAGNRMAGPVLPALLAGRMRKLERLLGEGSEENMVLFDACEVLPGELASIGFQTGDEFVYRREILREAAVLYPGEALRQAMYLDQHTFLCSLLDRNDRCTMGASIECRVPFLDYRLVEGLAGMTSEALFAGKGGKPLLRRAFGERLPREVLGHRKWGFGVPWKSLLQSRREFRERIAGLPDEEPIRDGPFDRKAVKKLISEFLDGDGRSHALVRQLFFVASWYRACAVDGQDGSGLA